MKLNSFTKIKVRYVETDKMQVVHHSNYYVYMEMGRVDYLSKRGLEFSAIEDRGYYIFITETHCKYIKPLKFGDTIIIESVLDKIGGASMKYEYFIRDEKGTLFAKGCTHHAFTNLAGQPVKIPNDIREVFTKPIEDNILNAMEL